MVPYCRLYLAFGQHSEYRIRRRNSTCVRHFWKGSGFTHLLASPSSPPFFSPPLRCSAMSHTHPQQLRHWHADTEQLQLTQLVSFSPLLAAFVQGNPAKVGLSFKLECKVSDSYSYALRTPKSQRKHHRVFHLFAYKLLQKFFFYKTIIKAVRSSFSSIAPSIWRSNGNTRSLNTRSR